MMIIILIAATYGTKIFTHIEQNRKQRKNNKVLGICNVTTCITEQDNNQAEQQSRETREGKVESLQADMGPTNAVVSHGAKH